MIICKGTFYEGFKELYDSLDLFRRKAPSATAKLSMRSEPSMTFSPMHHVQVENSIETVCAILLPPDIRGKVTEILFPSDETPEEQQVNQLNYNSFIHVMAEMMQKYAPKILSMQEDVNHE